MIVTAMADRDVVLRSILSSAFSYSGQKCSACSLLILEAELYDDEVFLIQLKDAVTSLVVGSSWELSVQVGPLCRDIDANLKRAMQLESGETWVVEPKLNPDNPRLMSPGVKRGVKPGSFFHQTECFGPILGIMKAKSLDHAIQIANDTPYGLTAGLQSLDEREHQLWQEKIQAGNLYINRSMTGAIVNRQPFGGIKESQFGSGFKAGGPHYLLGYLKAEQISMPTENGVLNLELKQLVSWFKRLDRGGVEEELLASSLKSYTYWAEYYRRIYDHAQLQGQSNRCRYLVCKKIAFWFQTECLSLDVFRLIGIQKLLKFKCIIGVNKSIATPKLIGNLLQEEDICFMKTSPDTFFNSPEYQMCHRLRYPLHVLSDKIAQHANQPYKRIETGPILASGHHELLRYLSEQTISIHTHRYGLTPGKGKAA